MLVLRPSPIQGVGVFTTEPIGEGDHVRLWQADDWRFVSFEDAERDPELFAARETYCVTHERGYCCPLDFHRMSIGWYMNHSDQPNVRHRADENYEYYASRNIDADEEILCDYGSLTPFESGPGDAV
jgi:hypothetical protein